MRRLVMAIVTAFCVCGCARNGGDALKMVTETTFPPYEFMRGREVVGVDVEICRAVAQKLGRGFECVPVDFGSVLPAVVSGSADIAAAGISVTDERKRYVDFSIPYATVGLVVVYAKASPYDSSETLNGRRIGVQGGTTSEAYVRDRLGQEPVICASPADAVAALKAGRVDFAIADVDPARNCVKGDGDLAMSDFITSEDYAIAIAKGRPDLLKAIDETISEVKADGRLAKWIAEYAAEADELKAKQAKGQ